MNAYDAVFDFERALCDYTGAKYAVTTTRCCIALQMCCEYLRVKDVCIPRFTYRGVPQAILRGGGAVSFHNDGWLGGYILYPYPIFDYARRLAPSMYESGQYQCLSHHRSKPLGFTTGGSILCDDPAAAEWFRSWGRDGEAGGLIGGFAYMTPGTAAELHANLHWFKLEYPEGKILRNSDYPDLSKTDWNDIWSAQQKR